MPYAWTTPPTPQPDHVAQMRLWPHRSLPPEGFAAFILVTFALICVPLFTVLGTVVLWGVLPFVLLAVAGVWWGLRRSYRDGSLFEELTLDDTDLRLERHDPRGPVKDWACNTYWARVELHETGGPVPNYVTLTGNGRAVEIGAFLSEPERKALYADLMETLGRLRKAN